MKNLTTALCVFVAILVVVKSSHAEPTKKSRFAPLTEAQLETKYGKIADAIYKVEGGAKTKHPYGILSVKTSNPRKVCLVTIYHNEVRWQDAGSKGDYLNFLADVYCPKSADPVGNKNWKTNIHKFLK